MGLASAPDAGGVEVADIRFSDSEGRETRARLMNWIELNLP